MPEKKIHIVCLDAPSPPDYGGVYDLYYKIPALAQQGVKIILHYFNYRSGRSAAGLEKSCEATYSYSRKSYVRSIFSGLPFIVHSRINKQLIDRLNGDCYPVLIEGIHCSGIINYLKKEKQIFVRIHNDEAVYYRYLYKLAAPSFKKFYFGLEAFLLLKYQRTLPAGAKYLFVSPADERRFVEQYGITTSITLPVFLPWQTLEAKMGPGNYCLYHGNLSVPENEAAAMWLIENIFSSLPVPLIIAGRKASGKLKQKVKKLAHVQLIQDPDDDTLQKLMSEAQLHVLPSFNKTGVKIKVLHALFTGRHCISNSAGAAGISAGLHICNTDDEWKKTIQALMLESFAAQHVAERQLLLQQYTNSANARLLIRMLPAHYQ